MIGLTGSHRTGKTTLAKVFAEQMNIPFVQTSASQVFKDMGFDPAVDYPFHTRMDVQERILSIFAVDYAKHEGVFITDRTPIDMMAYTVADVRQKTLAPDEELRLAKYCKACVELTNKTFSVLVVVQPGIPVVPEDGKASLSQGYINHVAHIIMGITVSEEIAPSHFYIPKKMTSMEDRLACITFAVRKVTTRHKEFLEKMEELGRPIVFH